MVTLTKAFGLTITNMDKELKYIPIKINTKENFKMANKRATVHSFGTMAINMKANGLMENDTGKVFSKLLMNLNMKATGKLAKQMASAAFITTRIYIKESLEKI